MADDVTIDPGSSPSVAIATDDCGGKHVQLMKLAYSADGIRTPITADADGLEVQLGKALPAGTNNIGDVDIASALPAGSAIIGKVGIDQTTPGTTNKVSIGTDGTVAIGSPLPAGTNAIGKLAANSGVDIGDVDVTSIQLANGKTRVSKRVALSASQTGATVWDPTGGTRFVLKKLVVSCETGGKVQFFDGTDSGNTVIGPVLSLADDGGYAENWDGDMPYTSAAADNILKYTTDGTFVGSVYVEGWEY